MRPLTRWALQLRPNLRTFHPLFLPVPAAASPVRLFLPPPPPQVKARVIGFRPLDGLAVLSLKPSVVDQAVLSLKDLYVGQILEGSVATVDDYGLLVSLSSNIKGLVPTSHMSDLATSKAKAKFKVSGR